MAGKAWGEFEARSGARLNDACADAAVFHGFLIDLKDFRRLGDGAAEFLGASKNHFAGFRTLLGEDDGHSPFQDPRLFGCDFAQRMAEKVFVVEIDAGDDRNDRGNNVGGVETSAEANFKHSQFDTLARKKFESHGGDTL